MINHSRTEAGYPLLEESVMTATCCSSSSSTTPTTLPQALAKLASDEADKASANTIASDQAEVTQFEKAQTPASQGTIVDVVA